MPNVALSFLLEVLSKYETSTDVNKVDYAGTLLNVSTILSRMKKHSKSLLYATKAVEVLSTQEEEKHVDEVSKVTMLCMAHYNMGAELEHLKNYSQASKEYEMGLKIANKKFDPEHKLVKLLKVAFEESGNYNKKQFFNHRRRLKERLKNSITFIRGKSNESHQNSYSSYKSKAFINSVRQLSLSASKMTNYGDENFNKLHAINYSRNKKILDDHIKSMVFTLITINSTRLIICGCKNYG